MDIRAGLITTTILVILFAILSVRTGIRSVQSARNMTFFRLRRQRIAGGWRMLGTGLLLFLFAVWLGSFGESVAYQYFPPSPTPPMTPSLTPIPTITVSPTITLTPTITDTPSITDTPTLTSTPYIPPCN